jgi:hypothetical protein
VNGKRFLLLGCLAFGWYSALWSLSEYEWGISVKTSMIWIDSELK